MSWCAVKDCKSGRKKRCNDKNDSDVRFFRFPKTSYYCDKWINVCGKNKNDINLNNARVCSLNFEENAYVPKPLVETMFNFSPRHKRKLVSDAVPTLKVWNTLSCIDYIEHNTTKSVTTSLVDIGFEQIHQEPLNNEIPVEVINCLVRTRTFIRLNNLNKAIANKIFDVKRKKHCEENNVAIPEVRKRKISTKIDYSANNQYFVDTKEEELRVSCFNVVLDDLLNGLNDRFNQETLNLILAVGNVLKLEPTKENLLCLDNAFEVDCNDLNGEIQLLRNIPGVPLDAVLMGAVNTNRSIMFTFGKRCLKDSEVFNISDKFDIPLQ
ncbi:hypothetical protein ACI65C_006411 [Semiaphis heraclei]